MNTSEFEQSKEHENGPTELGHKRQKEYRSPELTVYGDLQTLTLGGGGTRNEPGVGNPNTRA